MRGEGEGGGGAISIYYYYQDIVESTPVGSIQHYM